jgi:hypothetical protein
VDVLQGATNGSESTVHDCEGSLSEPRRDQTLRQDSIVAYVECRKALVSLSYFSGGSAPPWLNSSLESNVASGL